MHRIYIKSMNFKMIFFKNPLRTLKERSLFVLWANFMFRIYVNTCTKIFFHLCLNVHAKTKCSVSVPFLDRANMPDITFIEKFDKKFLPLT